jgi:hypothetical protein
MAGKEIKYRALAREKIMKGVSRACADGLELLTKK